MTSIIQTIEQDLTSIGKWVEDEFAVAAHQVWGVVHQVFQAQEPQIMADILTAVTAFLGTVEEQVAHGATLVDLETAFLNWMHPEEAKLLADVKSLGSTLVQALIALAIKNLPNILSAA